MVFIFNIDDCIAFLTGKVAKRLSDRLEKQLLEFGITRHQWLALYHIKCSGEITQASLAEKMAIKEPSLVRIVDKLESGGLLLRNMSPFDKRIRLLSLTPAGESTERRLTDCAEKFKDHVSEGITAEQLDVYKYVLETMSKNADYLP